MDNARRPKLRCHMTLLSRPLSLLLSPFSSCSLCHFTLFLPLWLSSLSLSLSLSPFHTLVSLFSLVLTPALSLSLWIRLSFRALSLFLSDLSLSHCAYQGVSKETEREKERERASETVTKKEREKERSVERERETKESETEGKVRKQDGEPYLARPLSLLPSPSLALSRSLSFFSLFLPCLSLSLSHPCAFVFCLARLPLSSRFTLSIYLSYFSLSLSVQERN